MPVFDNTFILYMNGLGCGDFFFHTTEKGLLHHQNHLAAPHFNPTFLSLLMGKFFMKPGHVNKYEIH